MAFGYSSLLHVTGILAMTPHIVLGTLLCELATQGDVTRW